MENLLRAALAELNPQAIQQLMNAFLPLVMAKQNPLMQTALQGLMASQARRGLSTSNYGLTQEAGLRGQGINNALQEAFQQAMNLAGQRASVYTGAPIQQTQPNYNMANAFTNAANLGMLAYTLAKKPRTNFEPVSNYPSPYDVGWIGTNRQFPGTIPMGQSGYPR